MRKCCVVGCNATNKTHRLFNFPKNDKLRELWLSFLIPVNAMLSGLSKDQLISRYVCQKHFDRYQFDGTGNRLQYGYPSLFTSMEILHGVPFRSTADNHLSDHNYAKQPTVSQNPTDFTSKVKNYALMPCAAASSSQTTSIVEIVSNKLTSKIENNPAALKPCAAASISQTTSIVEIVSNEPISNVDGEPTDLIGNVEQIQIESPSDISGFNKEGNKMINRCRSFANSMTKMADNASNMETPFSGDDAKTISNNHLFSKQFGKLPKQAQDFLLMQLKMANRKKEAMRFTTNEKLLCLSLMKDSPQGYMVLQKMFNLPSKRTLARFAQNVKFGVRVQAQSS